MGRNLGGFDVKLTFDNQGKPEGLSYWDQEGCGHEHYFDIRVGSMMTVRELVEYHLEHYRRSHEMTPPKKCSAVTEFGGNTYVCLHGPHNGNDHHFTLKGRS